MLLPPVATTGPSALAEAADERTCGCVSADRLGRAVETDHDALREPVHDVPRNQHGARRLVNDLGHGGGADDSLETALAVAADDDQCRV